MCIYVKQYACGAVEHISSIPGVDATTGCKCARPRPPIAVPEKCFYCVNVLPSPRDPGFRPVFVVGETSRQIDDSPISPRSAALPGNAPISEAEPVPLPPVPTTTVGTPSKDATDTAVPETPEDANSNQKTNESSSGSGTATQAQYEPTITQSLYNSQALTQPPGFPFPMSSSAEFRPDPLNADNMKKLQATFPRTRHGRFAPSGYRSDEEADDDDAKRKDNDNSRHKPG